MKVFLTTFRLPKSGNTNEEYEDASYPGGYPERSGDYQGNLLRFAVADGASEGMLSGEWARVLVKVSCRTLTEDFSYLLERAYRAWQDWERVYLRNRVKRGKPIAWFEDSGLQAGAFSTLLGLTFTDSGGQPGKWTAIAVGDTCLFHVRGESLVGKFPVEHSSEFSSRLFLVGSNPTRNRGLLKALRKIEGNWGADDRFYLMTDALACWCLKEHEHGQTPWAILRDLGTRAFEDWIGELRASGQIRNDDVTLVRIHVM